MKSPPQPGQRYLGGAFGGMPLAAIGIFAALDMKTNRLVWQQRWKDSCYSGSVTTAGGLVFVGQKRRPPDGFEFLRWPASVGISRRAPG